MFRISQHSVAVATLVFVFFLISFFLIAEKIHSADPCLPHEVLIGEDDEYYYCIEPTSKRVMKEITKYIDEKLSSGPKEYLGKEWRYRKSVMDTAGCLARENVPSVFGGKITFPAECVSEFGLGSGGLGGLGMDCSGFLAYTMRMGACFVGGFYKACFGALGKLPYGSANHQYNFFKNNKALRSWWENPAPGDAIFFKATYDKNNDKSIDDKDGVTHVAIFLGKDKAGNIHIIHTTIKDNLHKVAITKMSNNLKKKVVGYGNISKLYLKIIGH